MGGNVVTVKGELTVCLTLLDPIGSQDFSAALVLTHNIGSL